MWLVCFLGWVGPKITGSVDIGACGFLSASANEMGILPIRQGVVLVMESNATTSARPEPTPNKNERVMTMKLGVMRVD